MGTSGCLEPHLKQLLGSYELGLLSDEEARRVEAHVLECDDCFEDLYETVAVMRAARTRKRRKPRISMWRVPALAAAGILLAFSVSYHLLTNAPETKRAASGSAYTISLESPRGLQKGDRITFSWEPEEKSYSYTLLILDEQGDSVWARETRETESILELSAGTTIASGQTYYWKVVGEDSSGRQDASSPVSSFSLETD